MPYSWHFLLKVSTQCSQSKNYEVIILLTYAGRCLCSDCTCEMGLSLPVSRLQGQVQVGLVARGSEGWGEEGRGGG